MKARREAEGTGHRLFHNDREIGFIRGETVGFTGFVNADDAALAGRVAHLALVRHREKQRAWGPTLPADHLILGHGARLHVVAASGILATLRPPSPLASGNEDWGVELELTPDERFDILAIARAREMWTAMLEIGVSARMRQFRTGGTVSGGDRDLVQMREGEARGSRRWLRWSGRWVGHE